MKKITKDKGRVRGQTALETAFVFTMILFALFTIMNLGILFHTKSIATYAAFMSGRVYQVLGDQAGAIAYQERRRGTTVKFLDDIGGDPRTQGTNPQTLAVVRAAEDIFTCGLPWMVVPASDTLAPPSAAQIKQDPMSRCAEGKRKYKSLNINKNLQFIPFKQDPNATTVQLDKVVGGFSEEQRDPLRYGILKLQYRTPLIFGAGFFGDYAYNTVYVPALLNPGLDAGLQDKKDKQGNTDAAYK